MYAANIFELSSVDETVWGDLGQATPVRREQPALGRHPVFCVTSRCYRTGAARTIDPWVKVVVFMFFLNVQQVLTMLGWPQNPAGSLIVPPTGGLGWTKRPRDTAWCTTSKVLDPEVPAILKNNVPTG